jgi:uncharacterized protein (TIGR03067 family)
VEQDGQVTPAWKFFYKHIVFDCKEYEYMPDAGVSNRGPFDLGTYKIVPDRNPKELDFIASKIPVPGEDTRKGIYELDGDTLRFALAKPGQPRPTKFGPELRIEVWKRGHSNTSGQPRNP